MPPSSPESLPESQAQRTEVGLATITLRQIRVSRSEVPDNSNSADANPMNRLVPYLDLYGRLSDDELARITGVDAVVVGNLRRQVVQVDRALARFADLLPRLTDPELVRLTGATPKTIRFWRLCQPRFPMAGSDAQGWSVAHAADMLGRMASSAGLVQRSGGSGTYMAMSDEDSFESGTPPAERHPTGESPRVGSSAYRMPTAERESGSSAYRMPTGERESGSSAYRMPAGERESGSYRMPTGERESGRRFDPPSGASGASGASSSGSGSGSGASRLPRAPVDLSRPRTGRTQEVPLVTGPSSSPPPAVPPARVGPPPAIVEKQQAVAQQMAFSGAPFPGNDSEASGRMGEDDGIFIGLELPDPRPLPHDGRRR